MPWRARAAKYATVFVEGMWTTVYLILGIKCEVGQNRKQYGLYLEDSTYCIHTLSLRYMFHSWDFLTCSNRVGRFSYLPTVEDATHENIYFVCKYESRINGKVVWSDEETKRGPKIVHSPVMTSHTGRSINKFSPNLTFTFQSSPTPGPGGVFIKADSCNQIKWVKWNTLIMWLITLLLKYPLCLNPI